MTTCYINQNAGLGDIFLCQKIAKLLVKNKVCDEIVWPVLSENACIQDYLIGDNTNYVDEQNNFANKGFFLSLKNFTYQQINAGQKVTSIRGGVGADEFLYLPLEKASYGVDGHVMEAKFKLFSTTSENWQDFFEFKRNLAKEKELSVIVGADCGEEFILENRAYSTKDYNGRISHQFATKSSCKRIQLRRIDGYSIFDWCSVFERAKEIHSVNTSINFILEKLSCTDQLFMYKRPEEDSKQFTEEEHLFRKKYQRFL